MGVRLRKKKEEKFGVENSEEYAPIACGGASGTAVGIGVHEWAYEFSADVAAGP